MQAGPPLEDVNSFGPGLSVPSNGFLEIPSMPLSPTTGSRSEVRHSPSSSAGTTPEEDDGVAVLSIPCRSYRSDEVRPFGSGARYSQNPAEYRTKKYKRQASRFVLHVRHKMQRTKWYHSQKAISVRNFLHGKYCALVMVVALLIALFLPDVWALCGASSNFVADFLLTIVTVLFVVEFAVLCSVDATYFLSFFFLMDIVGTLSVIFDISFLLGHDATERVFLDDAGAQSSFMLLRAARAARVGARAGRLSRVLKFFRFLPFLSEGTERVGMAKAISGQLSNLLATRVACITILLVIVIPLFDLLVFPYQDYSLQTWVDKLSVTLAAGHAQNFEKDLNQMVAFFDRYSYGPFTFCSGSAKGDSFACDAAGVGPATVGWSPIQSSAPRRASELVAHTDTFMVVFNMHSTIQVQAILSIVQTLFIVFIMVFASLALSSVVTALAVTPLEHMLQTVRHIATTVFKFSKDLQSEEVEDETYDVDSSNEMKLLEKVVQKLAIIADLQMGMASQQIDTVGMQEEDIGVISLLQGRNVAEDKVKQEKRLTLTQQEKRRPALKISLADYGVTQEVYDSWGFNIMSLTSAQRVSLGFFIVARFHPDGTGYINTSKDEQTLKHFIQEVESEYKSNPFHNFTHAVDVLHSVSRFMTVTNSEQFLDELEQFSLLIAAVAHDVGHPGVNNGFLSEVGHELALQYNDCSPLENMHCAKLYAIAHRPENEIFSCLTREQYKEARKYIIECILHTDMMTHQAMVKELQMFFEMNSEVLDVRRSQASDNGAAARFNAAEMFTQVEAKKMVMNCFLHAADVSNPCKKWDVSQAWAVCVLDEFFSQGDQEKMLGIPVQFLNDREKLNRPNSQIGFIEFMIAPFFAAQIRIWHGLDELGSNLATNIGHWEDLWVKESNPDAEARGKVATRVQKVKASLEDAVSPAN